MTSPLTKSDSVRKAQFVQSSPWDSFWRFPAHRVVTFAFMLSLLIAGWLWLWPSASMLAISTIGRFFPLCVVFLVSTLFSLLSSNLHYRLAMSVHVLFIIGWCGLIAVGLFSMSSGRVPDQAALVSVALAGGSCVLLGRRFQNWTGLDAARQRKVMISTVVLGALLTVGLVWLGQQKVLAWQETLQPRLQEETKRLEDFTARFSHADAKTEAGWQTASGDKEQREKLIGASSDLEQRLRNSNLMDEVWPWLAASYLGDARRKALIEEYKGLCEAAVAMFANTQPSLLDQPRYDSYVPSKRAFEVRSEFLRQGELVGAYMTASTSVLLSLRPPEAPAGLSEEQQKLFDELKQVYGDAVVKAIHLIQRRSQQMESVGDTRFIAQLLADDARTDALISLEGFSPTAQDLLSKLRSERDRSAVGQAFLELPIVPDGAEAQCAPLSGLRVLDLDRIHALAQYRDGRQLEMCGGCRSDQGSLNGSTYVRVICDAARLDPQQSPRIDGQIYITYVPKDSDDPMMLWDLAEVWVLLINPDVEPSAPADGDDGDTRDWWISESEALKQTLGESDLCLNNVCRLPKRLYEDTGTITLSDHQNEKYHLSLPRPADGQPFSYYITLFFLRL